MVKPMVASALVWLAFALGQSDGHASFAGRQSASIALSHAREAAGLSPQKAKTVRSLVIRAVRRADGATTPITFRYLAPDRLRLDHVVSAANSPDGFWRHPDTGAASASVTDAFVTRMWDYLVLFLLDVTVAESGFNATDVPATRDGAVVVLQANRGFARRLLFDARTGMLTEMQHGGVIRQDGGVTTVDRRVTVVSRRRVEGVLWPWELTESIGSSRATIEVLSVSVNGGVTRADFDRPR